MTGILLSKFIIPRLGGLRPSVLRMRKTARTGKLNDPDYQEQWLKAGDVVEMEIDHLGTLTNTILEEETDWSILSRKK